MYTPDFWCIIKINSRTPHYRVFASWAGSYLTGAYWRMNSGIKESYKEQDYFVFVGSSGSIYKCHINGYGCHSQSMPVLNNYLNQPEIAIVDLLPVDTEWENMDWLI